jgi:solute carrier family 25 S-adenosylmethionine transporter 26
MSPILISSWWQGIEPRVLWIGIGGSIFFRVLEKTKSVLAQRSSRRDAKLKL